MIWRLVLEKVATLAEIEQHWTLLDVGDANEALDLKDEQERRAHDLAMQRMR